MKKKKEQIPRREDELRSLGMTGAVLLMAGPEVETRIGFGMTT